MTRIDDELAVQVDELIAEGIASNRSEVVRLGLRRLVDQRRREKIGEEIADAYRRHPQTEDELAGSKPRRVR